jgi:sugar/nucleoside kinase (ribokinase family)
MSKVFVFGTVAADIVIRVKVMPAAGEHRNGEFLGWRIGGAANIACAMRSAGHEVQLVSAIGMDRLADALVAGLHERGVETDHAVRVPAAAPRALIFVDDDGERTILGLASEHWPSRLTLPQLPDLRSADCLYVESYARYPPSLAAAAPAALIATLPPERPGETGPADLVIGSKSELPSSWRTSPFAVARSELGSRLRWVVVTDGPRGAVAYRAEGTCRVPARPARQVDATGAGDAFIAGVLHGLLEGSEIQQAMDVGARWGAATVQSLQSVPPPWEEVLERG